MGIKETRRSNLAELLTGYDSQRVFADVNQLAAAHVSQMVNGHRDMGEDVARRIEAQLGLDDGWMDISHTESSDETESKLLQYFRRADARGKATILVVAEKEANGS